MINEKIQNLLKELQRECEKEGVSALCTLHKEANALREESRKAKGSFEKKFGPMPDFEKTSVY